MSLVYKHYTQSALNRQYNNRLQTPDFAIYLERYELESSAVENTIAFEKDIAYGNHDREKLDIFPGRNHQSPVIVFIHGGYWRSFDKANFRFISKEFLPIANVVCVNYPLAPESTMNQIVSSCEKALRWIAEKYNGDIYLVGHSAGAHLAAMLLTNEFAKRVKGMAGLSGIYNLIPIQKSDINETLQMDEQMAWRNSPVLLKPVQHIPILLAVGSDETVEFKEQTKELNKAWNSSVAVEIKNVNHFSIIEPGSSVLEDLINIWNLK